MGDIQSMDPTQSQIESASTVSEFSATLFSSQPIEEISAALSRISDVDEISINDVFILQNGVSVSELAPKYASEKLEQIDQPDQSDQSEKVEPTLAPPSKSAPQSNNGSNNGSNGERRSASPFGRRTSDMTVRTNVERLNNLMNLVGELITDRNHLQRIRSRLKADNHRDDKFEQLSETVTHLGRITDQLQEEVMHIRMLPIGSVLSKFPRTVRDLSQKCGKLIDVVIHGEETEMDRSMIEEINDPLIHLIRNSVDHGIELPAERVAAGKPERGTITLTARHEQGRIIITVEDDGGGIDGERLRKSAVQKGMITAEEAAALTEEQSIDLMFMAGLSTAKKVTDISGRGVGLDIVNTNIQRINGTLQVETRIGQGTRFQIVLPLTLAIVPSLLVKVDQSTFAIPLVMITETLRLEQREVKYIFQKPVTLLRGNVLSLVHLSDIFNHPQNEEQRKYLFAVVVQSGKQRIGLIVDSLVGEEEVVVKPLGAFIGDIPGVSSAAILGEGQVALIVDVFSLFKLAGI
jgi:two-component system chemotaxis sensor kinase CheA